MNSYKQRHNLWSVPKNEKEPVKNLEDMKIEPKIQEDLSFLQRPPTLIEKGTTFNWSEVNPNNLTWFILNKETFLAWPGPQMLFPNNVKGYSIHIYNLSKMKKDKIIKVGDFPVSFLSIFKKDESKLWLYYGTLSGKLGIVELIQQNPGYTHVLEKEFKKDGEKVVSALIFQDPFNEDKNLHLIIGFDYIAALLHVYKINIKKKKKRKVVAVFDRHIENSSSKCSNILKVFYDEEEKITKIVCGYGKNALRIYHFKSDKWSDIEFKIESDVLSIDIVKNKDENLLIYTQCKTNFIKICNLKSGEIMKTVLIEHLKHINDLLIWNPNFSEKNLIVTGFKDKENSINIVNFRTCKVEMKNIFDFFPTNILKVRIMDNGISKEGLVCSTSKHGLQLFI